MRKIMGWARPSRPGVRVFRWLAVVSVFTVVLGMAVPGESLGDFAPAFGSWSGMFTALGSWLVPPGAWAASDRPDTPKQLSGTADGRGHSASTASTRAGGGAGHAQGKGQGELDAYVPSARKFAPGQSASARKGFDQATSQRVAAKSTATVDYYSNADGSSTRKFSEGPVNYRDGSGNWQPIDTEVHRGGDGRWRESANSLQVQFAGFADDPGLVSVGPDAAHVVSQRLVGAAHVAGVVSGSTVTFAGVLPGIDMNLRATPTGEKEELVLRGTDAASSWAFDLDLTGLTVSMGAHGSIVLADGTGKTVVTIPAGYAYDSKVDPVSGDPATTHAVKYELQATGGHASLRVTLDEAWLHDPARVFPVIVDPSTTNVQGLTTYASTNDGPARDRSADSVISVGSYDSGVTSARSFMLFPGLGLDSSGASVSAASLSIFDTWASTCTPARFDVAPITQVWTPSTVTTYPGPSMGASIGSLAPSVPHACANTAADRSVGDWVTVPLSVATFNSWAAGGADYGLGLYAATDTSLTWKHFGSVMSTKVPYLALTYTGVLLPQVLTQNPSNGAAVGTLTPQLSAEGTVDPLLVVPTKFVYQVFDANGTKVVDSGAVAGAYSVPAGKLRWGQLYSWVVQAFDGTNYSPNPQFFQFNTQVPQPAVTSSLSQNPGHGFDGSIGNYTTSATDAQVATVGPALSVVRDYNSRDPRTGGAFGAAWSSVFDGRAVERYDPSGAVSTVVVTYPDGSDVAYGRNADGSFTAPAGRASTLIRLPSGYELIDKSDTTYGFTQLLASGVYGIVSITDANARAETFTRVSGLISTVTSVVSGRALHLTWSTPSGATGPHVATVVTDPVIAGQPATAYTWKYNYSGDRLISACPPGTTTACTQYGYAANAASQTRNQVLDKGARSYWPLAETSGTVAASSVLVNEGVDNASYSGVTLGAAVGPLSTSTVTGAKFDGNTSMVTLPDLKMSSSIAQSMSFWFNAPVGAPSGVLLSYSSIAISATAKSGNAMPTIYLGTDGKLLGEYWVSSTDYTPNPIRTSGSVADGHWHHVVLTGSQTAQSMYLDGGLVGTIGGWGVMGLATTAPWQWHFNYLGVGFNGPYGEGISWPDQPNTSADTLKASYFKGSMADVAFYEGKVLTASDAASLYQAGTRPDALVTSSTRASGKAYSAVSYDPVSATVTHVTDENGGSWTLSAPSVTGSSQVYRAAVLGAGPLAYYRLGDAAGSSQAYSEVHYANGSYANTTLGVAGRFSDAPAAAFNGTSSSVQVPNNVFAAGASSREMWFKTTSTSGGVLLSSQASAVGATTCPCLPAMWITAEGKLRALSPSTTPTGPITAKALATKCLDVTGGSTANGTKAQVYTCINSSLSQNWTLYPDGSVRALGKCLDITGVGTANGSKVQMYECTGGGNQVWQSYNGGLRNPVSGRCLDDPGGSTANGTQFQIWDCSGVVSQQWVQSLASAKPVNDGNWHHAVLTADGGAGQWLYLDGVLAQASTGSVSLSPGPQPYAFLGAGYTGPSASGSSATGLANSTTAYFNGSIGEVAFYRSMLTGNQVASQFAAAQNSNGLTPTSTVSVTDPGGKALKYLYDPLNGNRMIASIDGLGNKTSYGYDTSGFMYTTTDPNGNVVTTGHDVAGNVVSRTTCQNRVTSACSTTYASYKATSMGVDVAKGGAVTALSSYVGGGWQLAALTDGNTATVSDSAGWTSGFYSSVNTTVWVQVDMGSARTVDQVALYPRGDIVGGFPQAFSVQVSADASTWTTVTTQTNYPAPSPGVPAVFGFTPANVRYVKVTGTTLRTDGGSSYVMQFAELTALNDRPDPTAGELLTQRDGRSVSATDNTYLTSYGYNAVGDLTSVTTPPVAGFPSGRKATIAFTDGTSVTAADTGFAPAGLPYRTTSPGGAVNSVSYLHNGSVASTTDAAGLVTRYSYDNLGRVTTRTVVSNTFPAGLVTSFGYDGQDQVVSETAPSMTDRVTGAVHTARTTTVFDVDGGITAQTVADMTGGDASRTIGTTYNAFDQVASKTDAVGKTSTFTYDGYGNKTSETDPLGTKVSYTFDPNGHLLTQVMTNYTGDPVRPQAAAALTEVSRAYDPAGRLASITNAMGNTTFYTYTDDGLAATATRTDSTGHNPYVEKADTYNAAGNLVREVTNNGARIATFTVDAASRQTAVNLDASGVNRTSTVTYTADDAVAANVSSDASGATVTTTAIYDPMGRTTSKSVSSNTTGHTAALTTSWVLDQRGFPLSQTDPNNNVTAYAYDEAGRLTVTTAPTVNVETNGATPVAAHPVTKRGYDTFGSLVETQDADGNVTVTGYDANGRAVRQVRPNYTPPGSSTPITAVMLNDYDAVGNLIQATDPLNNLTHYTYDQLGDLAQVTAADGGVTHSTYDTNGEKLSVTDPVGGQVSATYDHLGRTLTTTVIDRYPSTRALTTTNSYAASTANPGGAWLASSTSPTGVVTSYRYNNVGETVGVTDGAGNTTTYRYDLLGRKVAVVAPDGTSATVGYDQGGNPVVAKNLDAASAVLTTRTAAYDGNGDLVSSTDARGYTTTFSYDATGALTQQVEPVTATSSITTSFGRDAAGNRTRFTDGRSNSWIYTYNSWNQRESVIEPATAVYTSAGNRTTTYAYDPAGRPVSQVKPGGVTLSNTYDAVGNVLTQAGDSADAATGTRTFTYDLNGRVITADTAAAGSASASSETFSYDDRGDLLTATGAGGASSFAYNDDGSMTSRTDAAGTDTYTYDGTGRLKTIADAATGTPLTLSYNTLSQLTGIQYGSSGNTRSLGYDALHRLASDTVKTPANATVASIGYGYDNNGNEISKTTTGFAGATTNTYTYDQANRIASWNNGTSTIAYAYDDSGNRVQVGSNVYTYDARDELTGDGTKTYSYTARGTRSGQNGVTVTSDAFGQTTTTATQSYTYDAFGRTLTDITGATTRQFSYSGTGNTVAADGTDTYSRDPGGGLVGIGTVGGGTANAVLAYTDAHTDVVGDFTATGTVLSGSTAYDPLGNVSATSGQTGHLGFQSGWTDPGNGNVNMAARWYNPNTGQFMNKDTVSINPVPNSAAANPFAYVNDDPLTGTDPSGHGLFSWVSDAWHDTTSRLSNGWNATTSWVAATWNAGWHKATTYANDGWTWAKHTVTAAKNKITDGFNRELKQLNDELKKLQDQVRALNNEIKRRTTQATHMLTTAYHQTVEGVKTAGTYVKNHAGAIASFVVSTAVFIGCEAVLGAATGGVGAVAGVVACGALSGAVGGLVNQGFECGKNGGQACSAESFLKSGVIGGAVGGLSGLGGALAGKLIAAVGGKALRAVGGLFGRGGVETAEGAATEAAAGTAEGAAEGTAEGTAESAANSGAKETGQARRGAKKPASGERSAAGKETESPGCSGPPHSFAGATPVVLADGSSKPIDQVKAGDRVANSVPGLAGTQAHTVEKIIVTTTDHDFVDLTITPVASSTPAPAAVSIGPVAKLGLALATLAAVAGAAAPAGGSTLTTTFHHPFYDRTQSAFVEAENLHTGDELQTPTGTAQILTIRIYHSTAVTYDLTINGLHTYYVIAGDTPVLVHNCGNEIGSQVDPFDGGDLTNAVHNQRLADGARGRGGNYGAARLDDGSIITGRSGANWHAEDDLINQAGDRSIVDLYTERAPCAASCQGKVGGVNVTWAFPWNGADAAETGATRAASTRGIKDYIRDLFG